MTSEWRLVLDVTAYEFVVTCLKDKVHETVRDVPGVKVIDWGGHAHPDGTGEIYEMFQADTDAARQVRLKVAALSKREPELWEIDPADAMLKDEAQELVMAGRVTFPVPTTKDLLPILKEMREPHQALFCEWSCSRGHSGVLQSATFDPETERGSFGSAADYCIECEEDVTKDDESALESVVTLGKCWVDTTKYEPGLDEPIARGEAGVFPFPSPTR